MQFLVCLEMKIAESVALCAHIGIWNFSGYQEKGRACWGDVEPVYEQTLGALGVMGRASIQHELQTTEKQIQL